MNTAEADDEADDPGALAAVGCLRAISTILESVSRLPDLFVQVEPTLLPIMRRMLTTDGQGMCSSGGLSYLVLVVSADVFDVHLGIYELACVICSS
jgi:hypothetical protein